MGIGKQRLSRLLWPMSYGSDVQPMPMEPMPVVCTENLGANIVNKLYVPHSNVEPRYMGIVWIETTKNASIDPSMMGFSETPPPF